VIVVVDNSPTHKEHEGVWSLAKRALANSCPNDLEELVEDVTGSINAIRISTRKLRGCILQSGLPSFFALDYCILCAEINSGVLHWQSAARESDLVLLGGKTLRT
jgi:hypothetical protein